MPFPYWIRKLFQNDGAGDKLREEIMPKDYLPTSGGTMAGQIKSTVVLASGAKEGAFHQETPSGPVYAASCKQSTSGHAIAVGVGDTGVNRGVYASVTNGDDANGNAYPDMFSWLVSREGKEGYTYLTADLADSSGNVERGRAYLRPDGVFVATRYGCVNGVNKNIDFADINDTKQGGWYLDPASHESGGWAKILTANPQNANNPYVIATYHSGSTWYRKWSDGFIEQGGITAYSGTGGKRITLPTAFASTNYIVNVNSLSNLTYSFNSLTVGSGEGYSGVVDVNRGTTWFTVSRFKDIEPVNHMWYACGY